MPPAPPPPLLVETPAALARLADQLAAEPALAVDTEANSLFVYRERVCLIQISTRQQDLVIDPLSLPDLEPLRPLFANPRQQKVFHAAEYDLIGLRRDFGFEFANLFDTMVAARTLGWPQAGLAPLLETHFGVKMNKKHQRANWGKRPLTPDLLDYARLDTHYLFDLQAILERELAAAGRLEEAQEEFARLTRLRPAANGHGPEPEAFWRVSGARDLTPQQASLLRELHAYREAQAQRHDVPPFKVMGDATLIELALHAPQTPAELLPIPGMTEGQIRRHGAAVLAAIGRGQAAPPLRPPRAPQEPDAIRDRYDRLRTWRKRKAQERGVESDVILPREALWELARRAPRTPEELETLEHLGPWRRGQYGAELLRLVRGA
ncbi:MAG: ribonuclease D [Anaerolineales bacterium]|nr:ribonuclease D [Anaerolineales bacterium]